MLFVPGSSIHGSFQARVLEWGAFAFSGYIPRYEQISAMKFKLLYFIKYQHGVGK